MLITTNKTNTDQSINDAYNHLINGHNDIDIEAYNTHNIHNTQPPSEQYEYYNETEEELDEVVEQQEDDDEDVYGVLMNSDEDLGYISDN